MFSIKIIGQAIQEVYKNPKKFFYASLFSFIYCLLASLALTALTFPVFLVILYFPPTGLLLSSAELLIQHPLAYYIRLLFFIPIISLCNAVLSWQSFLGFWRFYILAEKNRNVTFDQALSSLRLKFIDIFWATIFLTTPFFILHSIIIASIAIPLIPFTIFILISIGLVILWSFFLLSILMIITDLLCSFRKAFSLAGAIFYKHFFSIFMVVFVTTCFSCFIGGGATLLYVFAGSMLDIYCVSWNFQTLLDICFHSFLFLLGNFSLLVNLKTYQHFKVSNLQNKDG